MVALEYYHIVLRKRRNAIFISCENKYFLLTLKSVFAVLFIYKYV